MNNEEILTQTSAGSVSFETPEQSVLTVASPKVESSDPNVGALSSFAMGVGNTAFSSIRALGDLVNRQSNFQTDYNPLKDIVITSRGEEFVNKYGNFLYDSPNPEYTVSALKKIDEQEVLNQAIAQNPISGAVGMLTGALLDPINLIPFAGLNKASKAVGTAIGAAEGAALGAVSGAATYQIDPNAEQSDIVYGALFGTAMGAAVGFVVPALRDRNLIQALKKDMEEPSSGLLIPEAKSVTPESAGAAANIEMATPDPIGNSAAYGTRIAEKIFKGAKILSPNQMLLNNPLGSAKFLATKLGGFAGVVKKNLEGIATDWDIGSMHEVRVANQRNKINAGLEPAYKLHVENGGKLSYPAFYREAMYQHAVGDVDAAKGVGFKEAAGTLSKFFDDQWDEAKKLGIFSEDAKKPAKYLIHSWDMDKISKDHIGFLDMVSKQIKSDHPDMSWDEAKAEAYLVVDDIKARELGNTPSKLQKSYVAKSTRYRTFQVDNKLAWKYLRDDWDIVTDKYVSQMEMAKIFKSDTRFNGEANPYTAVSNLVIKDKEEQIASLLGQRDALKAKLKESGSVNIKEQLDAFEVELNKKITDINKAADDAVTTGHDLLDALTGQADAGTSQKVRDLSKILRTWSYLNLMGSNVISQIPDTFRAIAFKMYDKLGFTPMLEGVAKNFIKLSPEDKAFFAYNLQNSGMSRAGNMFDIQDVADSGSLISRGANWVTDKFSKITLVSTLNRFNYNLVVNDVVRNVIAASEKLLKGELKDGSYELIELSRFGVDKGRAKGMLAQYMKHRKEITEYGVTHYDPNVSAWDSEVGLEFAAFTQRYVNRIIVNPSVGSKRAWLNTSIGRLVGQFKGYQFGAFEANLMNTFQTVGLTDQHTQLAVSSMLMMSLGGAVTQIAKDLNSNKKIEVTPEYLAFAAFNNGGVLPMVDYMSNIADRYGLGVGSLLGQRERTKFIQGNALEPFLGPSFGLVGDRVPKALGAFGKALSGQDIDEKDFGHMVKALPAQNLLYWNNILKQLTDGK